MPEQDVFAGRGSDVSIDPDARFFGAERITLGKRVRIDTGAVLSATHPIIIGDHVHIGAGAKVFANGARCVIADFVSLSPDAKIFTATDDFTGGSLANPTVPDDYKDITVGDVIVAAHVLIGAGSVVLPGSRIGFGASIGALSLVRGDVEEGAIIVGPSMRRVGTRDVDRLRRLEQELRATMSRGDRPGA